MRSPFATVAGIAFETIGDSVTVVVTHALGSATIALQGAQVLSYTPKGQQPVVWLSPHCLWQTGVAVRGGVPICWPWFGPNQSNPDLPKHGFARLAAWELVDVCVMTDHTMLTFTFEDTPETRALWPFSFHAQLTICVGASLSVTLTTHNRGNTPMPISEALHTYLQVSDVRHCTLTGLANTDYLDKPNQYSRHTQTGELAFAGEIDRAYVNTTQALVLHDPVLARTITVQKEGSHTTVIWNPGHDRAAVMPDLLDAWSQMLCIEAANAHENSVCIAAGETHTIGTTIVSAPNHHV